MEGETLVGDGVILPEVGMEFKDFICLTCTKNMLMPLDFQLRKRIRKGEDGELRYVTLTCSCESRRISNTSSSLK